MTTPHETEQPPSLLTGPDGESYILVPEFTEEHIRQAAETAIDEWSLATDQIPGEAIARLAATGIQCRLREHAADTVECDCGGENGKGWWCDFGTTGPEGLYVQFEFGVAEDAVADALLARDEREADSTC